MVVFSVAIFGYLSPNLGFFISLGIDFRGERFLKIEKLNEEKGTRQNSENYRIFNFFNLLPKVLILVKK